MLTNNEFQAILARYNYMVEACPSDRGMLERDRYCRDYAQKDIPALMAHIEHQQRALEWLAKALVERGHIIGDISQNYFYPAWVEKAINATKEYPCPKN